jgi:cellulose synthase/poly-beta-1,6-N-acetylglucosamine synthase-like glycosyltransferase
LSAGILGNGFALRGETLLTVPYFTSSIAEDLEYHLKLVRAGKKVAFTDRTAVRADMPIGWNAAARQRARWEGGRLRMLRENALPLARELLAGHLTVLEPLLELLTLPMSFQIALLAVILALGTTPLEMFALVSGAIVATYFTAAVLISDGDLWDLAILPAVPFYIGWKLMLSIKILRFSRKDAKWLRTPRTQVTSEP